MTDDETVRSATAAVACLKAALMDPDAPSIVLTRDEALLTLGIVDGIAGPVEHSYNTSAGDRP